MLKKLAWMSVGLFIFERHFVGDGMTNFVWQELREAP